MNLTSFAEADENGKKDEENVDFYEDLAKCFAMSIFKCLGVGNDEEISLEQMKYVMTEDK